MHPILLSSYLIDDSERESPCTLEMERAAILCLSEAKRKKAGILSRSSEKISCIAKLHYPLWAVPWDERCIIIDGLDMISSSIKSSGVPDVLEFTEALQGSSSSLNLFLEALKRHSKTFKRFKSLRKVSLKGVIGEASLLKSLVSILRDAGTGAKEEVDATFIPSIPMEQAEKRAYRLIMEWKNVNSEIDSLSYAIEVLNEEAEHHKEKIFLEIKAIQEDYDLRISRTKKMVDKKVKGLIKEKERIKGRIEKAGNRRLESIIREKERLKDRFERLNLSLREALEIRKRQKRKYPKRSTTRIDNKIVKYRSDMQILKEKISNLEREEERTRREILERLREAEERYGSMIKEELEKIRFLEEARSLEISERREMISKIDQTSSAIEAQIRELIAGKTREKENLEKRAVSFEMKERSLIGIPFYLAIFRSPRRERAEIYPPMIARSYAGTLQRIRRAFFSLGLESRMNLLLNPRFPDLDREIFQNLKRRIESSLAFRKMIFEVGRSNNLLKSPSFADDVADGISELEGEGWISRGEKRRIMEMHLGS